MATYKYYFYDLLTHTLLDELGSLMFGVNFSMFLSGEIGSKTGQFTGTCRADSPGRSVTDILNATTPGRTALWIDRDDQPVWCGILWSRTYQATGRTFEFSAQTYESYPHQLYNQADLTQTLPSQDLLCYVWNTIQANSASNVGVAVPAYQGTGTALTRTLKGLDYNAWGDVIDDCVAGGCEYYVAPLVNSSGVRTPTIIRGRWDLVENPPTTYWRIGVPVAQALVSGVDLQYPTGISEYWWPENAVQSANAVLAIGKANGASTPRQVYVNNVNLNQGYPLLEVRLALSDVEDQNTLNAIAAAQLTNKQPPLLSPTIILAGAATDTFGQWGLGDNVKLVIDDPYRFPNGPVTGVTRIVGYSLTPAGQNGPETVNLTIDNIMNLAGVS